MDNKETTITIGIKDMSLLVEKPHLAFIFKKTQKVSQAIFMVSDMFDVTEPLRLSLRQSAADMVAHSVAFLKKDNERNRVSNDLQGSLIVALSLSEAAYYIRLISEMNYLIIQAEIQGLLGAIDAQKDKGLVLSRNFLEVEKVEEPKRQTFVLDKKDIPKDKIQGNKTDRSQVILSMLGGGAELTIKDITAHLKGISEKTVQRELLSMVAKGILKKKGERRWSRYSL